MSERANPIVVQSTPRRSSITEVGAALKTRISHWAAENPEAVARLLAWFKEEVAERSGEPGLLTLGRSLLLSVAPPNWQSLPIGTHERVDHLICETGICLVWVPEADVIVRLLDAPTRDSRVEVLLYESTRILDSTAARLDEVTHPEAVELRGLAIEAVEVHRSGYFASSQALAASIITAVIEKHYGFKFKGARDAFEAEAPAAAGMWSHRRALVQRALQFAIDSSWMRTAESGFNRHLTGHGSDPCHFSEAHAIEALMLMGGSLRELNETYRVADMGFGPSPRLQTYAAERTVAPTAGVASSPH